MMIWRVKCLMRKFAIKMREIYQVLLSWMLQVSNTKTYVTGSMRPGSMRGSIISLTAATVGAGTLTLPYIMSLNGLAFGTILVIFGAFLSYYSGMLLVKCDQITGKYNYESLAKMSFGKTWRPIMSLSMLVSMIGFQIACQTLLKTLIPELFEQVFKDIQLPYWLQKNDTGTLLYATLLTVFIILPLSIPSELNQTMFVSTLGSFCSIFTVFVIVYEFFMNDIVVPDKISQIRHVQWFIFEWDRIVESIPFIVFLYMYQGIIPQMYKELDRRSLNRMDRIILRSSYGIVLIYLVIGIFGYLTFSDKISKQLMNPEHNGNILECDYQGSRLIQCARLSVIVSLIATTPLCIIPAKQAYMQMTNMRDISDRQNIYLSVSIVLIIYVAAITIPNISGAITLSGATVNPFIGFIFPILFYLKLDTQPLLSRDKLIAILVMIFIVFTSVLSLQQYFSKKS
eukprot:403365653